MVDKDYLIKTIEGQIDLTNKVIENNMNMRAKCLEEIGKESMESAYWWGRVSGATFVRTSLEVALEYAQKLEEKPEEETGE